MDQEQNLNSTNPSPSRENENLSAAESQGRRELVTKLGKFAIYAAPFTVMALNSKAATASGPRKH